MKLKKVKMAIFTWKINFHPVRFVHPVTAIGLPLLFDNTGDIPTMPPGTT